MKKALLIFSLLGVAGAGVYFYMKSKKDNKNLLAGVGNLGVNQPASNTNTANQDGIISDDSTTATNTNTATSTTTTSTNGGTPAIGTPITSPEQVQALVANTAQAQSLAIQIFNLRGQIQSTLGNYNLSFTERNRITMANLVIRAKISALTIQLTALGFKEVNGSAIRL